ncbi:MAG: hypothetical protein MR449_02710 [Spirochaetia bacterium]|nr:hypothetical protein [Spirochaetia bacterium]
MKKIIGLVLGTMMMLVSCQNNVDGNESVDRLAKYSCELNDESITKAYELKSKGYKFYINGEDYTSAVRVSINEISRENMYHLGYMDRNLEGTAEKAIYLQYVPEGALNIWYTINFVLHDNTLIADYNFNTREDFNSDIISIEANTTEKTINLVVENF